MYELYPLSIEYKQLVDRYNEAVDEETMDQALKELLAVDELFEDHLEQACRTLRNLEAESDILKREKQDLASRQAAIDMRLEKLKHFVVGVMRQAGRYKVELKDSTFKPRLQKNSRPSFFFEGEASTLPEGFRVTKYSPDDAALLKAWKDEAPLPAGVTWDVGSHLRF